MSEWREVLASTPECIDIAMLDSELDAAQQAHLATCVRCKTELDLLRAMQVEEKSLPVDWIVSRLQKKQTRTPYRIVYAAAAAALLVIFLGVFLREPSIDVPLSTGTYRSARLDVIAPNGDIAEAPNELRWSAVSNSTQYRVQIVEIDATQVWSTETSDTFVTLPADIRAKFAPGKTLLWTVHAYRGDREIAASETQNVRVKTR